MAILGIRADTDPTNFNQKLQRFLVQRFAYIAILGVAGIVTETINTGFNLLLLGDVLIAGFGLLVNVVFLELAKSPRLGQKVHSAVAAITIVTDTLLVTATIYTHGGIESRTVMLYAIPILASGIIYSRQAAYYAAIFSAVVWDTLLILQTMMVLPRPGAALPNVANNLPYLWQSIVFYNFAMVIIALLVNLAIRLLEESQSQLITQSRALERAQHLSHTGSWERDLRTGQLSWSSEMLDIFGVTTEQQPKTFEEFFQYVIPEDRQRLKQQVESAIKLQTPLVIDVRIRRADGSKRILHVEAQVSVNETGQSTKISGSVEDITERTETLNQLRTRSTELEQTRDAMLHTLQTIETEKETIQREQSRSEALITSIGDGVIVTDDKAHISRVNKPVLDMLGYAETELIGAWFPKAIPYFDDEGKPIGNINRPVTTALLTGKPVTQRGQYKRRDGTLLAVTITVSPIIQEGKPVGAIEIFRDVTRERQLENMKDEFVSVASHELRTPMGAIRALTSMLLDGDYGPVNPQLVEPLNDIKDSTLRLVDLVNDMLDVARIEAGRMQFVITEFDIVDQIKHALTPLTALGKEKGVIISSHAPGPVKIQGDANKITQVVTNLVGNSLKFTDKGSITVNITAAREYAEVDITDTGVGISPEDQTKLFGKFHQIATVQAGKPKGTGLGLYISREIIRHQGGELWIKHSEMGKGSTFSFRLPVAGSAKAQAAKVFIEQEAAAHPDQK